MTAADAMDWIGIGAATDRERAAYKAYYFGNLDRLRYVIQNDVDVPLSPLPRAPMPITGAFQNPVAFCPTRTRMSPDGHDMLGVQDHRDDLGGPFRRAAGPAGLTYLFIRR